MCIVSSKCMQQYSIFSLLLSRVLVVVFSSLDSDVKFYAAAFQEKSMTCKMSFLNHKSPCHSLKNFKLLNKRVSLFRWNDFS